jgi:hypothetical protein
MYQLIHLSLLTLTNIPELMFRHCKSPSSGGRLVWSSLKHPLGSETEHLNSPVHSTTFTSTDSIHNTRIYISHHQARLKNCKIMSRALVFKHIKFITEKCFVIKVALWYVMSQLRIWWFFSRTVHAYVKDLMCRYSLHGNRATGGQDEIILYV